MDENNVVVRDVPIFMWVFGLIFFAVGGYLFLDASAPKLLAAGLLLVGMLFILLMPIVTVSVDRGSGVLVLQRTSVVRRKRQEIPLNKISGVYVERKVSTDSDGTSITYRVVLTLHDGEEIPLRQSTSSGFRGKEKQAEAIRSVLGVGGVDQDTSWVSSSSTLPLLQRDTGNQEALIGIAPGEHETNGVRWEMERLTWGGASNGSPVVRWMSTDFETPGYFLFLAQRVEGQGKQKGLMNLMGNMLIKQSIKLYGFDESYTPGLDKAAALEDADRRLVDAYFIHTSSPVESRRILNPWAVMPLVGWADRYALELRSRKFHQLSVLFSPYGVYVSVLNLLDASQADDLVSLGVELVRAQGV